MVKDQHVIANLRGGWSVRHTGAARATRVFDTQEDAVEFARDIARKERSDLYVHRRDGTIRERSSYGNDPFPARDKE